MAYHSNGGYSGDERESRSGDDRPDSDLSDKPIYILEHLATFTVNKETGIVYPADGMRRLLQLEKTTGIWSQKMQLCLDNQWVLIMDYESGNVIERFPASLIQEPTAFTSNDPMEMYNNILVFVVAGPGGPGSRSEMHIFQSQNVSAVHLVEDLKQLRSGKIVTQHRETIPPPPMKTSLAHLGREREREREREQLGIVGGSYQHETDSELGGINDETSSTSSDRYERDVTVLNHCFDDIEKFIARLQHAAAASRELERRRRNKKSKKRDPGEGLLTLRTRPPHEKEFVDIFAKFKLSFNLLAKLKAHIHDPNAPELVHFLFTPLALIVEASSDTYYESHLPARVVNPLLTREAVNLLINCVTSKETELWRSLGDAWTIPRDQWKGHVGSYHPVFFDGWSPDYPVVDELEHSTTNTSKRRSDAHHNFSSISGVGPGSGTVADYDIDVTTTPNSDKYSHPHHHRDRDRDISGASAGVGGGGGSGGGVGNSGFRDFSARSDISIDSIERNGCNQSTSVNGPGPNNSSSNSNNAAIQNLVGGIQTMGGLQSSNNLIGQDRNIDTWLEDLQSRGAKIVQVTYPRTANNDKELTVVRGEYLEIVDDSRKWWKARNSRGQVAHVPHTIVTPYNYNDNGDVFNNPIYSQNYNKSMNRHTDSLSERYTQSGENTSPAGLLPTPSSAEWIRNKHIDNKCKKQQQQRKQDQKQHQKQKHQQNRHVIRSNTISNIPPPPPPPPPSIPLLLTSDNSLSSDTKIRTLPRNSTSASLSSTTTISSSTSSSTIVNNNNNNNNNNSNNNNGNGNGNTQNEMHEELKQVLTLFREKRHNLEIIKTPEIYIQQTSTVEEVEEWLKAKGFSDNVLKKLHGLNGNELFSLKRETLEDFCGIIEGRRLASQITIQRNISGYKTARSSELQAILARARQKTEIQQVCN